MTVEEYYFFWDKICVRLRRNNTNKACQWHRLKPWEALRGRGQARCPYAVFTERHRSSNSDAGHRFKISGSRRGREPQFWAVFRSASQRQRPLGSVVKDRGPPLSNRLLWRFNQKFAKAERIRWGCDDRIPSDWQFEVNVVF